MLISNHAENGEDFESLLGKLERARELVAEVARGWASAGARLDGDAEHVLWVNAYALEEVVFLMGRVLTVGSRRVGDVEAKLVDIERRQREEIIELLIDQLKERQEQQAREERAEV
jgi:hypothetical protein